MFVMQASNGHSMIISGCKGRKLNVTADSCINDLVVMTLTWNMGDWGLIPH